jgi:hypothetical protein
MKHSIVFAAICLAMVLVSCEQEQAVGSPFQPHSDVATVTQATMVQQLGRVIDVRGMVDRVCQDEGCWMTITDGSTTLLIQFEDEAGVNYTVPLALKGQVTLRGVVADDVVPEDVAKNYLALMREPKSRIDAVKGDSRVIVMKASGVRMATPSPE